MTGFMFSHHVTGTVFKFAFHLTHAQQLRLFFIQSHYK